MSEQGVETHACVPTVVGPPVFALKERCLRRESEPSVSAHVQPVGQLVCQITTERNQTNAPFTRPNPKIGPLQVDVDQM
jgi:hypothetical protein